MASLLLLISNLLASEDQPGQVDRSFDIGSILDRSVEAAVRQADGKWVIGGRFTTVPDAVRRGIARFNDDGSTDLSFMGEETGVDGVVHALAIQSDGKILVGGSFSTIHGASRQNLARLNADGSLDLTFRSDSQGPDGAVNAIMVRQNGTILIGGAFTSVDHFPRGRISLLDENGTVNIHFGDGLTGANAPVHAIAIQENGGILVGGAFTRINGRDRGRIARLMTDGSVDVSFGDGVEGASSDVHCLLVQSDGQILIGGAFAGVNGSPTGRVARLNPDGTVETDFPAGHVKPSSSIDAFALQQDGKILIGGGIGLVRRLNADGSPDDSFTHRLNDVWPYYLRAIHVLEDQRIFVAGRYSRENDTIGLIAQLETTGDVDDTFSTGISGPDRSVSAVAIEKDGSILVGGRFRSIQNVPRIGLARLGPDGILNAGFADPVIGAGSDSPHFILIQEDEKILVGGYLRSPDGATMHHLIRLLPDGTHDESFANPLPELGHWPRTAALQPDGKILIGGRFDRVEGVARGRFARLHPDGTLDRTFAEGLSGANYDVLAIAVQEDGKVVIGGEFTSVHGETRNRFARLNLDGTLDTMFARDLSGVSGEIPTLSQVDAIAIQNDGKILIGGAFGSVHGKPRNGIARLNADGTLDTTFGHQQAGAAGRVMTILLQDRGRVLITGGFTEVNGEPRPRAARLLHDGSLDHYFGHDKAGPDGWINAAVLDEDENVVLIGSFSSVNEVAADKVARLHAGLGNRPPSNILLSDDSVAERDPVGTVVGTLTAIDPDPDDAHVFVLVSGAGDEGNSYFEIEDNLLKTTVPIDSETPASLSVRVRAIDRGDLFLEKVVLITVIPNEPPSDLLLSSHSVPEDRPVGTPVGMLSAIDSDDTLHVFILVNEEDFPDNGRFVIDESTLKAAEIFEYSAGLEYLIRIRATDPGGRFVEKTISIEVRQDSYRAWAAELPDDQQEPDDDPGGYGIANILRYAFNLDPLHPEREKLPRVGTLTGVVSYLTITFTRRTDDSLLSYIVEGSHNFETWSEPGRGSRIDVVDDENGETETVTFTDNHTIDTRPKRFLRLSVER